MSERAAISATISGRVQGVGFRFAVARAGREHGLDGWVRNTAGGDVEVWAEGDPPALDRLTAFLRVGPPAAHVTSVVIRPAVPNPAIHGFNVRY
jgi:acylphosphatase